MNPGKVALWAAAIIAAAGMALLMVGGMQIPSILGPAARTDESPEARLRSALILPDDLPAGWGHRWYREVPANEVLGNGAFARVVSYEAPNAGNRLWLSVSHYVYIYPSEEQSRDAYQACVARAVPKGYESQWISPPELTGSYRADEAKMVCLDGRIDGIPHRTCTIVARYGDMVSELYANVFLDRWLTMPEFKHLVERMDARMDAARMRGQNTPAGTVTPAPSN